MSQAEFRSEERNKVLIIFLPSSLRAELATDLEKQIKLWLIKDADLHVLDFSGVMEIDRGLFKTFIEYKNNLSKALKKMAAINVSPVIRREINANGLSEVFHVVANLNEAYRFAGIKEDKPQKVKLDANFVNPFIQATMFTFQAQMGIELKAGKPVVKKERDPSREDIGIAGVINLTCKHFTGTIAIAFREEVFLNVYEIMLGEKHDTINEEVRDAAGEILNIIYGQAKKELNRVGYELEKAIPTILSGKGIDIHHGLGLPAIVLPFECDAGQFILEVSVTE